MQIKLFNYSNNKFNLQAIIDDVQQASFEHNYYAAGQFTITLNYNIPNAKLFKRGLFVQFGSSPYDFGEITSITNSIGENGKGSEFVNITGYDARYLFKRRIISNLNNNDAYNITADGETCIRSLISSQCTGKRSLPVNMGTAGTLGETYTVSESYSNLYDVLQTIATQTNIGWRLKFSSGTLTLEVYQGEDKSKSVFFSEEMDSLKNGTYQDSNTSYANAILIAGKGSGSERDIYEGEELIDGDSPAGLDRFEAFDNQAELTTTEEYETEADAMLRQYGQTLTVQGAGLIKSPYVFREQYDIGDYITLSFSDKTAKVQITSVTEQISWNNKTLSFTFGKPVNGLDRQLDLMLKKIQSASSATSEASTNSVKWYTTPTDTAQDAGDVTFNTLGFTGSGGTFTLYLDDEKTGSKSYHLYIKNLTASLVLTTNKGATDLTLISGSYIANIFVDEDGNIINQGMTATDSVVSGNTQPVTSDGVNTVIDELETEISGKQPLLTAGANIKINNNVIEGTSDLPTDAVLHYSFDDLPDYPDGIADVRLLNNNTYDIQSGNYYFRNNGGVSFSNNNGNLKISITGGSLTGCYLPSSLINGKIIKSKLKVTSIIGIIQVIVGASEILNISNIGDYEILQYMPNNNLYIYCVGSDNSCEFTIEQIYIGDGSYSTPIIDNANGQNNATNNGGIAVQGVSGKGAYFLNGKYVDCGTDFQFSENFSCSIWCKPEDFSNNCQIVRKQGVLTLVIVSGDLKAYLYDSDGNALLNFFSLSNLPINQFTHIVVVRNGLSFKYYKNGVLIKTASLANTTINKNDNILSIGSSLTEVTHIEDDLLIFDRALTETEVMALYNNKANTPKYYNLNNYKLPAPPTTDGSYTLNVTVSGGKPTYSWS